MKKILAFTLVILTLFLCACTEGEEPLRGYEVSITEFGFTDPETGVEYEMFSNPISVYALERDEPICNDGNVQYYSVKWEDSAKYLCDKDGIVYKAVGVPDLTIDIFDPVAAFVYYGSAYLTTLYCEEKYRDPEISYPDDTEFQDDSDLVYAIRDAILNESETQLPLELDDDNTFTLRMLSANYPGLYYVVVFTVDTEGNCYLYDRATRKAVYAPQDVIDRFIGDEY